MKPERNATIKLGDYFRLIKPKYSYLKLTPDTSIRNYDSANIARSIQVMLKPVIKRIKRDCLTWSVEVPPKLSFFIDIQKEETSFYFIVPENYRSLFEEKITETWNKITIEEVEDIALFSPNASRYYLQYKNEDALSLNCDKKCNEPLTSVLGVLDIMEEGDRVGVFYNFLPTNQGSWKQKFEMTMKRYHNNECLLRSTLSAEFIFQVFFSILKDAIIGIGEGINELLKKEKTQNQSFLEIAITKLMITEKKELSTHTLAKRDATVIDTQIMIQSDSEDNVRKSNNCSSVIESFKTISGDNELIHKKFDYPVYFNNYKIGGVDVNKMSVDEIQNFLELPGRTLLDRFKNIKKIDVLESPIPEELQSGSMCLGNVTFKGKKYKAYLTEDQEYKYLTLCVIAPTRAGKSTFLGNISVDAIENDECTLVLDWVENCGLSKEIKEAVIKRGGNYIEIDLSKDDQLQGLGYNEVRNDPKNPSKVYENAKIQTTYFSTFIDSINLSDKNLSAKMDRYLESACLVAFIQNGSVKDVFNILQNFEIRKKFISNVPESQLERLDEYISSLKELDEVDKKNDNEVIGTKYNLIAGIMDRLHKLKKNAYMEMMLKKDCRSNIDLVSEMQQNQVIFIKMPEFMFGTEEERDVYATYWLTKIWLAFQVRASLIEDKNLRKKVNIVLDELYQVPNAQKFVTSKISQCAKFRGKFIISCMYLQQIGIIREELRSANSSYMLISGCDKQNYKELKEELYPYNVEDLINLPRYHSLNLIKCNSGFARFVTELPKPIK